MSQVTLSEAQLNWSGCCLVRQVVLVTPELVATPENRATRMMAAIVGVEKVLYRLQS
jgi:hypothetical protein